ncbi:prephenate dehydrogenase/arogenate dehydrogenase family protein [Akkermansiaceae bacterium]|nr:prephenate dehydrogenase/arogenate dehydrogenase family protein [Akkermansiaceae bacterium]MDA7896041.1 prephenate dehydrogenase/arogenate dehydrogenase family protein [bacterium]MDA7907533.1 prephenate dehydrogenase/arogenate dehydrogenase family protein [Akkermansiaceae bacterium]MDA7933952.1 prephenate dehydrogenase/arogenate dehydrogenase family protein [Akkermansiaceae bacterium]MDB4465062.1 prephenate dehydrogenase/arogenate dehydrogenase family protein [Akkermansiaceae bacterium]
MSFSRIAILGPGLLGGSVGLAAQAAGHEVILWGRNPERVEAARKIGLEATCDLRVAVLNADLVILAVPVGVMGRLFESLNGDLKPGTLVTDVGSVKVLPHEVAGRHGVPFIGSHPMAGSEQTGIEAARADLFKGAACALTNDQERPDSELQALAAFWQNLGCSTSEMNSQDHDRAVARISHLPHAMAVATAGAALRFPGDESLAAGGFRDTTRVASGDPAMWAEIMVENRAALTAALKDAQKEIREMLDHLAKPDKKGLQNYLSEVKARKENPSENL